MFDKQFANEALRTAAEHSFVNIERDAHVREQSLICGIRNAFISLN